MGNVVGEGNCMYTNNVISFVKYEIYECDVQHCKCVNAVCSLKWLFVKDERFKCMYYLFVCLCIFMQRNISPEVTTETAD